MNITIFGGNQPRHLALVRSLSVLFERVFFISEIKTVATHDLDDQQKKSSMLAAYFSRVACAENKIFGEIDFLPDNVTTLAVKLGDLSNLNKNQLSKALNSDIYIVFGASYIKGWLIDFLISRKALNVHMGLSPYYRGAGCNFWALYDQNPGFVGATIHRLNRGLDDGPMLFHCLPKIKRACDPFEFSMHSVLAAHNGLIAAIKNNSISDRTPVPQNKSLQIRYSRHRDLSDTVANQFLEASPLIEPSSIIYPQLLNPYFSPI